MSIVLDIIIIAIIALSVVLTMKKGFVRSILGVASLVLTLLIISAVAPPAADFIYDSSLEPKIYEIIDEQQANAEEMSADAIWSSLPAFIANTAENAGVNKNKVSSVISDATGGEEMATRLSTEVIKPVAVSIITVIIDVILFSVLMIIFRIISKIICRLFKAPVLNQVNGLLGAILGLVKGVIFALLVSTVLSFLVYSSKGGEFLIFTKEGIENSVLFSFFAGVLKF